MLVFWAIVAVFVVITFAFLLPPLFKARDTSGIVSRKDLTVTVYQDQFSELDNDLKNETISQDQYNQAKVDLEKNLLDDMGKAEKLDKVDSAPISAISNKVVAGLIVLVIPISSVILYNTWGGGVAALDPESIPQEVKNQQHKDDIDGMLDGLITRLDEDPTDGESWYMLARTYQYLKRYPEAITAFERALPLGGNQSADVLSSYADSIAMASNRVLTDKAIAALELALEVDPVHIKSLWLLGTSAYQEKRLPDALKYWERLVQVLPADSEEAKKISTNIGEVRALMGMAPMPNVTAPAPVAVSDVSIQGNVSLSPELISLASPEDTVFVFARSSTGSRMPLAIIRKQVKDLPFSFTLDDSLAMNVSMRLSSVSHVIVGARVSKTGNAMPQPGDLEGVSDVLTVSQSPTIDLVIRNEIK